MTMRLIILLLLSIFAMQGYSQESASTLEASTSDIVEQKKSKQFNITLAPLQLMYGALGLNVEKDIGDGWSLGGQVIQSPAGTSLLSYASTGFGFFATNYFTEKSFENSFYVSPGLTWMRANGAYLGLPSTTEALALTVTGGYNWLFDQFNIKLGAGGGLFQNVNFAFADIRMGWVF